MGNGACFSGKKPKSVEEPLEDSVHNRAFVFIKPHAQNAAVQELVKKMLADKGIKIEKEGTISGKDIDEKKLIDQHYYSIASKATLLKPKELPVPADKFEEKFGESWASVLESDKAMNAMDACAAFGIDTLELNSKWEAMQKSGDVVKFGGGFYCGKMVVGEKTLYVFNAFFMSMRGRFTAPEASIQYYAVSWPASKLSWSDFRGKVLGPTNPAEAPAGAIRKAILDDWEKLGLKSAPDNSDNGVHASASPFEGLAERMNWLEADVTTDAFGSRLISGGIPKDRLVAWSKDAQVDVGDGKMKSIFDELEDTDTDPCLKRLLEINGLVKASE